MCEPSSHTTIAPHRGFNSKAREVLIGGNDPHLTGMTTKSASEFDLRRKVVVGFKKSQSPASPSTPKTPNSTSSFQEPPMFDSIGERPVVKRHKQLSQIGKTKSCGEFKNIERRLIKTYQEENIIKMPSIDSELTNLDISSERGTDLDEVSKARVYEVSETQKKKNVVAWLSKQS
ncbi:hypothetical protein Y032_0032g2446 [Ancylostoma ceylanicum]|uniref:Uncharacterized protein n=1 Tax=Ancylostoma ceylanicum TaxID=53326 RepID=A0A016UPB1_9BILA|nr:hypothetical protein Y032_0032g2446 [Ancylostoma ceylanicum]